MPLSEAAGARRGTLVDAAPLTEAQEGLWYAQRLDPDNPVLNTGQYLDIRGTLDVEIFRDAVNAALAEAEGLSVRIIDEPGGPLQILDRDARAALEVVDLSDEAHPDHVAQVLMQRDMSTPVDPTSDRLVAEILFVLSPDRHFWYQRVHHLAIDGYGTALLSARVAALYNSRAPQAAAAGSALGSYAELLAEDAAYRISTKREADRQFWLECFHDQPDTVGLSPGVAVSARTYRRVVADLVPDAARDLQRVSERANVSWPDILVALAAAYVGRLVGGPEVCVGVATMNRFGTPAARVPAMVMNVLPVRIAVNEHLPIDTWLVEVAKTLRRGRRHGHYRSEQLRRDLGRLGGDRRLYGPLINVLPFDEPPGLAGLSADLHVLGTGPVDDLTITLRADADGTGLRLELDANPTLYSEPDVADHATRLAAFIGNALRSPSLERVATLTGLEQYRWLVEVNDTSHAVPKTTLTALIEASFERHRDAPALVADGRTLTYADFDRLTADLAQTLTRHGAAPGHIVAVALPRSIELVVALVAILRAGAAYLPIDPDHPRERLARTLDLAQPALVISSATLRARLPADLGVLTIECPPGPGPICRYASDHLPDDLRSSSGTSAASAVSPDDAAYVIYTSGSTGDPKGVVIEHLSIVNRLEWMRQHYGIDAADRILQKTPATFDVSVWEFFLPFVCGATLVVAPPEAHKDPSWLAAIIRDEGITTMHFVPSMLAVFLADPAASGLRLRRVFVSGEALSAGLRDRFHEVVDAELHNLYGPTEAAVDVTFWNADRSDRSSPVPIGRPVWNTRMYVLDAGLRPLPPAVPGDLYIAGIQVAREYLGRPDLTAERFIPDPFVPGERMYSTGDRAQWRRDGAIEFLGRADHQVKIRGLRVELGEIEAAILTSPLIRRAVVVMREDRAGDQRLVAYVVPAAPSGLDVAAVRASVETRVPSYMVPSAFVTLETLPLSRNGKLDRGALPPPEQLPAAAGRAPATVTEEKIAHLFARVLGLPATSDGASLVTSASDFFALGGHSLLAARLMLQIREELQVRLALGAIFANPTVATLASFIDGGAGTAGGQTLPEGQDAGLGVVIPIVRAGDGAATLFCIHPAGGIAWCYGHLGRALTPPVAVFGLQARGLDPNLALPERLDDIAADYVNELLRVQRDGPFHLCGWSVGGIIAHAMAVRLQELGHQVATLAMLDAYPCDRWRNEPQPDERAAPRALLLIAGVDPASLPDLPLSRQSVIAFLRDSGHLLGHLSDAALTGVVRVVEHNSRLVRAHRHRRFDGDLLYFRAALDHQGENLSPSEWAPYVGGRIDVHDVRALHAHLTGPEASARIAAVLGSHLTV